MNSACMHTWRRSAGMTPAIPMNTRRIIPASAWRPNPLYDRLLALRQRDEAAYTATTSTSMRLSIAYYEEARAAAAQLEQETNKDAC